MAIRGFVLGVILLAAVGCCIIQETNKQTQARYRLEELSRKEDEIRKRLLALRAEEGNVRSPASLAALLKKHNMELVALRADMPDEAAAVKVAGRKPGAVLDDAFARVERPVRIASAGDW